MTLTISYDAKREQLVATAGSEVVERMDYHTPIGAHTDSRDLAEMMLGNQFQIDAVDHDGEHIHVHVAD
jgi:hypothetical protein